MAQGIPLVRAMALLPSLRWMTRHNITVEDTLRRHDLSAVLLSAPTRPVPLLKVGALLRELAKHHGPDLPCRIVAEAEDIALVQVGRVALGARTPAEALARINMAIPFFCSHELINLTVAADSLSVHHAYGASFDSETLHLMSQYALAVVDRICAMSGAPAPREASIELPAHPEFGVAHLAPWFDLHRVTASDAKALKVTLEKQVAERPFLRISRDRSAELASLGLSPLRNSGFSESVCTLIEAILEGEEKVLSLKDVADTAGMSPRTLQRRIAEEGKTFKSLVDEVRQKMARRLVADDSKTMVHVAHRLGYSRQTSLNRSMIRWTGKSPKRFRRHKP